MQELWQMNNVKCSCGKLHAFPIKDIILGKGVAEKIPQVIGDLGAKKPFVLCDKNTFNAAGEQVINVLKNADMPYSCFIINQDVVEPDEKSVGSVVMHYDYSCDIVIAVGSGVINDIGKILSAVANRPYVIFGTAPSMDGYASASSSMTRDGLKISLPSKSADVIMGDIDVLKNAPLHMLKSGLGDMIAKYVSICEWRISHIVTGEYYCEKIANLVKIALKKCIDNASGLLNRDEKAVEAVFKGLVICGAAMTYAGLSRPASGVEHYFSHVWDMRGVEFGDKVELHGIQCAVGTLIACGIYEKIIKYVPDKEKALSFVNNFDLNAWNEQLKSFIGKGALSMIELEKKEGKYDKQKHSERLEIILSNWAQIVSIIKEEVPSYKEIYELLTLIDAPKSLGEIGVSEDLLKMTFKCTKDIRNKYVLSTLCWDLGIIDQIIE